MESKKGDKKTKVLVAIPRGGLTMTEAVDNQIDMAAYLGRLGATSNFEFMFATIGRIFVAKAREEFATFALDYDCDYLFMVDDDMICPADLFSRLYQHNVDIVAPLAFQRREPYFPVIYMQREGFDKVRKEAYFTNEIVKVYPKDKLFECDAVGFGAVLIKTKVLRALNPPRFMSTNPSGEDILFCYNARKAKFRVYVDTSTKIQHLGHPIIVDETLYEKHNRMEKKRKYIKECHVRKEVNA